MKEIIFLNRSYNDLDIQASLIDEFSQDKNFKVRVIGYPSDGHVGTPSSHEAAPYFRSRNVNFETIFDSSYAPLGLKSIHRLECIFRNLRKSPAGSLPIISFMLKASHIIMLRILAHTFNQSQEWLEKVTAEWRPDIIILDEVSAQPNRSQIVDSILPRLAKSGTKIYTILTGQNIYNNFLPSGKAPAYKQSVSTKVFLPSPHDKQVFGHQFPNEKVEVAGNLRMNKSWIQKLHSQVLNQPFYNKDSALEKLPQGKIRIVFMLSKINYGIKDVQILADTIKSVGHMEDVAVAIKPHTRGMKIDFLEMKDAGNAIDASDIPSTILLEWADVVFFTGSGIAFHALWLEKHVGFLKFCQTLETIFDDGTCVDVLNSSAEATVMVEKIKLGEKTLPILRQKQIQNWLNERTQNGLESGEIASLYKNRIMQNI